MTKTRCSRVERHKTRIERCYFQAIETLRKVQKDRLREERLTTAHPAEIGFVLHRASKNTIRAATHVCRRRVRRTRPCRSNAGYNGNVRIASHPCAPERF